MDKMESLYKDNGENAVNFSLLLPRASYITHAFTCFVNKLGTNVELDAKIRETNSMEAINAVVEQMDKFLFDRLDSISDEASNLKGDDIPIILICSDRREKSEIS